MTYEVRRVPSDWKHPTVDGSQFNWDTTDPRQGKYFEPLFDGADITEGTPVSPVCATEEEATDKATFGHDTRALALSDRLLASLQKPIASE